MINRAGGLREISEETIKVAMLPEGEAEIKSNGLKYRKHFYTNQEAMDNGWFTLAREEGRKETIRIHAEEKAREIYYLDPVKQEFITFTMVEHEQYTSGNLTWEEDEALHAKMEERRKKQNQKYTTAIHRMRKRCDTLYRDAVKKARKDRAKNGGEARNRERIVENFLTNEREEIKNALTPGGAFE